MRIVRFLDDQGQVRLGTAPLPPVEAGDAIDEAAVLLEGELFGKLKPTGETVKIAKLLRPIEPVNLFCIGANYAEHVKESGLPMPDNPVIFMKPTTAANDPGEPIRIPAACDPAGEVDYECELAIVIGRQGRDISEGDALDHVLGYTAANDVSARKWQKSGGGGQWIRGKSFDTFCPLGPAIVTADDIPDPQALTIRTVLNGEVMQNSTTGDMIFTVAKLIAFVSRDTTLLPGTVILTGTPPGVGFARQPAMWLKKGDVVAVELEKVGRLVNPVE